MSTSGDLFAATEAAEDVDFDAMLERTLGVLDRLLAESPVCIAWSGGKDSSCLLSLTLDAARRRAQCGEPVRPIVVMTSDTLVESPEIVAYARTELRKVEAFGQRHGLDVRTVVVSPRLTESWAMTILSGRSLPSFMGSHSDCTVSLKTNPLGRAQKRLDAEMPGLVTLLGTRFSESLRRASNMRDREETAEQVWIGKDGRRYLSPLAYWTLDHVWTYVGTVMALETERTYSDFAELHRIYTDASGGGCVVVAEMAGQVKSSPCGARTGCWTCVRAERDKSLEAMIESDPRYGYMRGLNALRNLLVATRFDWSLRTWMPWAPEPDGTLVIQPYRYRPRFLALLLHLCLSLDLREKQAAAGLGIAPRFEIVSLRSLIAIDAAWSLHVGASEENVIFHWTSDGSNQPRCTFLLNNSMRRKDVESASCVGVKSPSTTRSSIPGSNGRVFRMDGPSSCICWPKTKARPRRLFRSSTTSANMAEPVRFPGRTKWLVQSVY